ncbi:fatty acid desaturase family protein [Fluviicola sp.]|uniref:fatty acid desaturase family protein n=1 Tax=Fluviicola sp. TaxID=1917219 RepID=UPI003D2E2FA0
MKKVQFSKPQGEFFSTLRKSVQNYFDENQLETSGNWKLYLKTIIIITTYIAIYLTILLLPIPGYVALLLSASLGFVQALVGFNIMHDANHDAFSSNQKVNYFFGLSMNALGSDAFMWKQKHNLVHHTYTNIDGIDDDISKTPFLRMSDTQPRYKAHRFQHIYLPFLYGISTIYWVLVKDFEDYIMGSRFSVEVGKMKPIDHVMFWTTRMIYFGLYLVLPSFVWGIGWTILGFTLMHMMLGLTMSFVFQLAHVVENVEFEHAEDESLLIENEWAVHQLATTSDFAVDNKVVSWLVGGLNFQVEHHLFPRISHVHYPEIQKIVAKTCKEFGVTYYSYDSTGQALASHFRHMKRLGRKDVLQPQLQGKK